MTARRVAAAAVIVVVVAAGLVVHLALADTTATDIAGDALYPLAVYAFVVLLAPRLPPLAAGSLALAWCVGVEVLQITGAPEAAASVFPPAVLVLGTVFDLRDVVVYTVVTVSAVATDLVLRRVTRSRLESLPPDTAEGVIRVQKE